KGGGAVGRPPATGGPDTQQGSSGPAVVALDPALLTTTIGAEFTIRVTIENASGVGSVPFHLRFDPDMIEFVRATQNSPFLSQGGGTVFVLAALGGGGREVVVGLSRQGTQPGVDGRGTLIELTFRASNSGRTLLDLTGLSVLGPTAQPMPAESRSMNVVIQ
ncbi:MAG: cohesin domain-containing protein, partial [Acidobacteria bacterium]|nr:cohesin domain-containing protein [Acidobacteriota bacterium]